MGPHPRRSSAAWGAAALGALLVTTASAQPRLWQWYGEVVSVDPRTKTRTLTGHDAAPGGAPADTAGTAPSASHGKPHGRRRDVTARCARGPCHSERRDLRQMDHHDEHCGQYVRLDVRAGAGRTHARWHLRRLG